MSEVQASRESLIFQAKMLLEFVQENLVPLEKLSLGNDEENDYYFGLIIRQGIIISDIIALIQNSYNHNSFSSLIIFCRCIIDDYIRLNYLLKQNSIEALRQLNAEAYKKNIQNLLRLGNAREEFAKTLPKADLSRYPDKATAQTIELQFQGKNPQYFTPDGKFKKFPSTRSITDNLPLDEFGFSMNRCSFLWSHFSDYIHYSSLTYKLDSNTGTTDTDMNYIQESIFYSYKVTIQSLDFFVKAFNFSILDKNDLKTFYSNAEID